MSGPAPSESVVLGVHLAAGTAYLAMAARPHGALLDVGDHGRIRLSTTMDAPTALNEFLSAVRQAVRNLRPDCLALLHTKKSQWTYAEALKRASLESCLMLAGAMERIEYLCVKPGDVAKSVGLPGNTGTSAIAAEAAKLKVKNPGSYWGDRCLAYATARSIAKS